MSTHVCEALRRQCDESHAVAPHMPTCDSGFFLAQCTVPFLPLLLVKAQIAGAVHSV